MWTASGDTSAFLGFLYLLKGGKKFVALRDETIGWIFKQYPLQKSTDVVFSLDMNIYRLFS